MPPHPLHKLAGLMRKFGIFLSRKIAKCLHAKEINFFIFFANSKIVQACLVLSGHFLSIFIVVVFSGYFARLLRYLPAGQSSMCKSTPPVDQRKRRTRAKFRAKKGIKVENKGRLLRYLPAGALFV